MTDQARGLRLAMLGFAAGFVAVIAFHQLAIAGLGAALGLPLRPWSLVPVAPFGVPQVVSTAFWGGVWGIALVWALRRVEARGTLAYVVAALAFGAVLPSLVWWFVVSPLKGAPILAGGDPARIALGLFVNGVWGVGTGALVLLYRRFAGTARTATP